MARVLCTGVDPVLVATRRFLLEKSGHTVVPATDEQSTMAACQQNTFDVVVIGQMVGRTDKQRLMSLVRLHCPSAKVLELFERDIGRVLEDADSWLEVPAGVPKELADCVAALALARDQQNSKP
jgi:CheY-like chemotaxis protein